MKTPFGRIFALKIEIFAGEKDKRAGHRLDRPLGRSGPIQNVERVRRRDPEKVTRNVQLETNRAISLWAHVFL